MRIRFTDSFLNRLSFLSFNEEKFTTLEEKAADALEVAAQAHEEREEKARCQVVLPISSIVFISSFLLFNPFSWLVHSFSALLLSAKKQVTFLSLKHEEHQVWESAKFASNRSFCLIASFINHLYFHC